MTPERFRQVEVLFHAALAHEPRERTRFVAQQCGEDAELLEHVLELLAHHESGGMEPEQPFRTAVRSVVESAMNAPDSALRPTTVGGYRILRPLGEGGFGVVYLAEQEHPRRTVAVKLLRSEFASGEAARRFEYEARILARLKHPGIARIYEAGVAEATMNDESGGSVVVRQPFLALEYIEGPNLMEFALGDGKAWPPLPVRDRLALFARVCDALQHAHQHGVIHRDLKPDNILVAIDDAPTSPAPDHAAPTASFDTAARLAAVRPTVLDFGVARLIDGDPDVTRAHTQPGHLVGTLAYMSPEQVSGDGALIDTRSDIYAMGVLLYQLLSGRLPYEVHGIALPDAARVIREHEPPPILSLDRATRAEANAIVQCAMAKDRDRRYASMAELAADVRRLLAGEPVLARGRSAWYVLGKAFRRHRVALSVAAGFLLLLTVSSVVGWSLFVSVNRANARANALLRDSYLAEARATRAGDGIGRRLATLESLRRAAAIRMGDDLRTEAIAALTLSDFQPLRTRPSATISVRGLATIDRLAVIGDDGTVTIEDAATGREISMIRAGNIPPARWRFSPDGAYLGAGYAAGNAGAVVVWRVGEEEPVIRLASPTLRGEFLLGHSAGRSWLATVDASGRIDFRHLPSSEVFASVAFDFEPSVLAISADGSLLAAARAGGRVLHVLRVPSGDVVITIDSPVILRSPCFSPDGTMLITGGSDGRIHRWDTATWQPLPAMDGHRATVADVIVAGGMAVSGGWDGSARLWNWRSGRQLFAPIVGAAVQGFDGRVLVVSTPDEVRVLSLVDDSPRVILTAPGSLGAEATAAFSDDGRFLLVSGRCGLIGWNLSDMTSFVLTGEPARSVLWIHGEAGGESGRIVAIVGGELRVWDADALARTAPTGPGRAVWRGARNAWITHDHRPGGVVLSDGRQLLRINLDTGESTPLVDAAALPAAGGERPDLDPTGRWLFMGTWQGPPAAVYDAADGRSVLSINQPSVRGNFSPDGSRLLVGTPGSIFAYPVGRWDTPHALATYHPRLRNVAGASAASPDGSLILHVMPPHEVELLTAPAVDGRRSRDGSAPPVAHRIAVLPNPEQYGVPDLRLSPDGSRLVVLTLDEIIMVWHVDQIRESLERMGLGW